MPQPVILSDIGKVLIDFDFSIAARRLAERCDHPAETVLTLFDGIKGPYEVGDMDDAEFVRQGIALTGFRGPSAALGTARCAGPAVVRHRYAGARDTRCGGPRRIPHGPGHR